MKKVLNYSFALFAGITVALACSKVDVKSDITDPDSPGQDAKKQVSISVSISEEGLTRVAFTESESDKSGGMKLSWEVTDVLDINGEEFTIAPGSISTDGKTATFEGPELGAGPYTITYIDGEFTPQQTQQADADTGHLKYYASLTGVDSYQDIAFTQAWAEEHNGTFLQSGILRLRAQMPTTEIAASVREVKITAFDADGSPLGIFQGDNALTLTLTDQVDTDEDRILDLYFNLPTWDAEIPANASIIVRFKTDEPDAVFAYTRYHTFTEKMVLTPGTVNALKLNCTATGKHAGNKSFCDGTTAEKAYLIGDMYQLQAIDELSLTDKTYFKLIDDIDLDGFNWTSLNSDGTKVVDLDGNGKTITKLGNTLFADFNGSVTDLTIDQANVSGSGALIGIFANTIKTAASTLKNVDINNSSVSSTNNNPGALVSQIDAAGTVIENCDIANTEVKGYRAGGLAYFFNTTVTATNCTFIGGKVEGSNQYIGGLVGSVAGSSVLTNCRVEDATITATRNQDVRTGGLIGMLQQNATVKGCTVGTDSKQVIVSLPEPASGKVINGGGFVGVLYGTITKDTSGNRSKAYAKVSCGNTSEDQQVNVGGFVGFHRGVIESSDAYVTMTSLKGKAIGGFAGYMVSGGIGSHSTDCTVSGSVSGSGETGGFVGKAEFGSTTNCSSSAIVSRTDSGNYFGSFAGSVYEFTMTECSANSDINCNANYVGGFIGGILTPTGKQASITKCYSSGTVTSGSSQCGGFIGHISAAGTAKVSISDCYTIGNVNVSNQRVGGFIGQINSGGSVTISKCFASGAVNGSFAVGGLVGFMNMAATIEYSGAWNSSVTPTSFGDTNWSSGAVIGVAWPTATLTNNYRQSNMSITAWWVPEAGYQHPDVSSSSPLIVKDLGDGQLRPTTATSAAKGQDNYPQFAYHGNVVSEITLSELASTTLGWDSDIWNFTGLLPRLKWTLE